MYFGLHKLTPMKKIVWILPLVLLAFSCKKKGCMDSLADNYSSEAKKDDKSCSYSAPVIFWMDSTSAKNLISKGYTKVKIVIAGSVTGELSTGTTTEITPGCSDTTGYTTRIGLEQQLSQDVDYSITTMSDSTIRTGKIKLQGGTCVTQEINY